MKFIGLDFETTGTDPWGDSYPIEIGLAVWTPERGVQVWDSLIRFTGQATWSEESAAIHGITKDELAKADPINIVDIRAANWLLDQGARNRMLNITVGWNVAGFDRQFVTRHMPVLNSILSYRTVDLNALVFDRCRADVQEYKRLKERANTLATEGLEGQWHRAGFDAARSVMAFHRSNEW